MSYQDFAIGLHTAADRHTVKLRLDAEQMSQRGMIECFEQQRFYEAETTQLLGAMLRPGDTFIDIGAHVGYFSMVAVPFVGPHGTVLSFEPEFANYGRLVEHIALNQAWQVQPVHMAVGSREDVATFFVNADNDGGHALWDVSKHDQCHETRIRGERRTVFVTTLDRFLAQRPIASLKAIKIDAEGSELAILRGAEQSIRRYHVPFIIAEVNRFALQNMGTSEAELRALMTSWGYETYIVVPGETTLARLNPDSHVDTEFVFNLLFRHPSAPSLG
jgi:FkbM family methyltransferase